ncbi:MAG: maturase [Alphaproteobacteria bacterium]|nr:maturase [Alphaproteobacteria bacterium]
MRKAETVLTIISERGKRNLPLGQSYRQLYNPSLYLHSYDQIQRNHGAMTKGVDQETVDGMSPQKITDMIDTIRKETYRWKPVRRKVIPKANGKSRHLGIPSWSDKLLQTVMKEILEAYYEPQFSNLSHGFRPRRGCHTALMQIKHNWHGIKWFIEGDIRGCYDHIDHEILLSILKEKITDNRFLRLLNTFLKAGYMEDWQYKENLSGAPQGATLSPLIANIYLNKLDQFIETQLIPKFTKGGKREKNPYYDQLTKQAYKAQRQGLMDQVRELEKQRRQVPSNNPNDPQYRRLRYVRYADDFLLGFTGTKEEAVQIKQEIQGFLQRELRLELSQEKTKITHARSESARFLGYDISIQHCDTKITANRRSINGNVRLKVPKKFVQDKARFYRKGNKPIHRKERTYLSDYSITCQYQSEYRGYVQYYKLAENMADLNTLHWTMRSSLLKTLAHKHKSTVKKMSQKYKATVGTIHGPRKCLEVRINRGDESPLIARFGGIPLVVEKKGIIEDQLVVRTRLGRSELLTRLLKQTCEQCGANESIEVHHIRKLSDLDKPGRKKKADWVKLMAAMNRKTLVLCQRCHRDLHAGRPMRRLH